MVVLKIEGVKTVEVISWNGEEGVLGEGEVTELTIVAVVVVVVVEDSTEVETVR